MNCLDTLGETELTDLEIFRRIVTPHYKPSSSPLVMCVGASDVNEGAMLRAYHSEMFGTNGNLKIAACNTLAFPNELSRGQYDLQINHPKKGNASHSYPYHTAQSKFELDHPFDMVYIRNPDLDDVAKWANVFQRAIGEVKGRGMVITLIKDTDLLQYKNLLIELEKRLFTPLLSQETGMGNRENPASDDFFHTIGLFK